MKAVMTAFGTKPTYQWRMIGCNIIYDTRGV
jgi:hypothetical protein